MKWWWMLAVTAAIVLAGAAVWMGGLNQDEGWYLYAANLVASGQVPYRDFFFTQGPVMPLVYSCFTGIWNHFGLLGARIFNVSLGLAGILLATSLARRLAPPERKSTAALLTFVLLATNLYHLYYLAIPKTYALASLFVLSGFNLLVSGVRSSRRLFVFVAGLGFAFAVGTRISLLVLPVAVALTLAWRRDGWNLTRFVLGTASGLMLVYGPYCFDSSSFSGLLAAQGYHVSRGGFDPVWTVGSISRIVRWYLPLLAVVFLGDFRYARALLFAFLAVFALQLAAPFPYDDYQVPIMALAAVFAAVNFNGRRLLPVVVTAFAVSFGSPLLEKWTTDGQDRFWTLKKETTELAQLRQVAEEIRRLDPDGGELLTQDLYLAIETGRKVPKGLEMGPFSQLTDAEWRRLLSTTECPLAALSGYSFAILPPKCERRPMSDQLEYWHILRERYELVSRVESFGQQSTPLLILKRK